MISTIFDHQLIALTCSSLEQLSVSTLALKRAYLYEISTLALKRAYMRYRFKTGLCEISYVIVTLIWYIRYSLNTLSGSISTKFPVLIAYYVIENRYRIITNEKVLEVINRE